MLASVGLDSGSLGRLYPADPAAREVAHSSLIERLIAHGVVVFGSDADRDEFFQRIRDLPGPLKSLWSAGMERIAYRTFARQVELTLSELVEGMGDLGTTWNGVADVAFVERSRAVALGLPLTQAATNTDSGVEVVRMEQVDASHVIAGLQQMAYRALHAGESRDALWAERFGPVAAHTAKVTIVDRYAMDDHHRWLEKGKDSGLQWLLDQCVKNGVLHAHLITRAKTQKRTYEELLALRAYVGGLASLTVTFIPEAAFRDAGHARHVRFDMWAFSLDKGCEVFAKPITAAESPCQYGDAKSLRRREHALEQAAVADELRQRVWP